MISISGAKLITKSVKLNAVKLPIMIFGGSPISVAAPPILAVSISAIMKGRGLIFNVSDITKLTGTINRIVVTLSSSPDAIAVIIEK